MVLEGAYIAITMRLAAYLPWRLTGCSKMSGCKAPEILSREAYFLVR